MILTEFLGPLELVLPVTFKDLFYGLVELALPDQKKDKLLLHPIVFLHFFCKLFRTVKKKQKVSKRQRRKHLLKLERILSEELF